ncbi:hypothetical protein BU25DRAFT_405298 [Macroventuria anomochaeta]|uniref:Uncharacterized protein n=1 Tax=Macroventuria anomochaeta TaxID=301207 RepID=A0ACB6SIP5_9PLEO|nr:uncharacterized protein BU25DRAFT_405298 [Macroventuria anomochaeta]KAF2633402.1 hypothetical protein BU25DRAFT_405298 [Macroventuria anomochaeta]
MCTTVTTSANRATSILVFHSLTPRVHPRLAPLSHTRPSHDSGASPLTSRPLVAVGSEKIRSLNSVGTRLAHSRSLVFRAKHSDRAHQTLSLIHVQLTQPLTKHLTHDGVRMD